MRGCLAFRWGVRGIASCMLLWSGCAGVPKDRATQALRTDLKEIKVTEPIRLELKADPARVEKVAYLHRSKSKSFDNDEVKQETKEELFFISQAQTLRIDPATKQFTQVISIVRKEGGADLHDFAMPDVGEKLEITGDSKGRIIKSGDYPTNSIFYVSPISLPPGPVEVGDTWTMQASWLSLGEMVPYQLDMLSILKRVVACGKNRCAELEISGEVSFQGPLKQALDFKSVWRGLMVFDIDAGTVLWSRVDSEERFSSANAKREVNSCLEATLQEPADLKLPARQSDPCSNL